MPEGSGDRLGQWGRVCRLRKVTGWEWGDSDKEYQKRSGKRTDDVIKEASLRVGYSAGGAQDIPLSPTSCSPPAVRLLTGLMRYVAELSVLKQESFPRKKQRYLKDTGFFHDRMVGSTNRGEELRATFLGEDLPQYFFQIFLHKQGLTCLTEHYLCLKLIFGRGFVKGLEVPDLGFSCHIQQFLVARSCFSLQPHSVLALVSSQLLEHSFLGQRLCTCKEVSSVWKPLPSPFREAIPSHCQVSA